MRVLKVKDKSLLKDLSNDLFEIVAESNHIYTCRYKDKFITFPKSKCEVVK